MCMKVFLLSCICALPVVLPAARLRIIHINDIHGRIEQTSQHAENGRGCSKSDEEGIGCYGGFPRLITAAEAEIKRALKEEVPIIFVSGGDTLGGTIWYSHYKWRIVAAFMERLNLDAMCLGASEFEEGIEGLAEYLKNVSFPVLGCNVDTSREPTLQNLIKPSRIFAFTNITFGIIGYTSPKIAAIAKTGKLIFQDEIKSIKEEVKVLKSLGVKVIIALGHSGYKKDIAIAEAVPDINVIIGSQSEILLYTGEAPDIEIPIGPYPALVLKNAGRIGPIVQAYAYTKYLGFLEVSFDDKYNVDGAFGNPILLNSEIPQDKKALAELEKWREEIDNLSKQVLAKCRVTLNASCRYVECNLGNLITDAFVNYGMLNLKDRNWTGVAIALFHAGGIHESILSTNDVITSADIMLTMPVPNQVSLCTLKGKYLIEALEWSVAQYEPGRTDVGNEFLQVSGLHVLYNLNEPVGSRVVSVTARCAHCKVPAYFPLNLEESYPIAIGSFIARGGYGYTMLEKYRTFISNFDDLDLKIVTDYITNMSVVYAQKEERIQFTSSATLFSIKPMFLILSVIFLLSNFVISK